VIPPACEELKNAHAVTILQLDSATSVCGDGFYEVHITSQIDPLENVVFNSANKTVKIGELEYKSWEQYISENCASINKLLSDTMELLISQSETSSNSHACVEVYHTNTARPLFARGENQSDGGYMSRSDMDLSRVGITVDSSYDCHVTFDDCVAEAERIFSHYFPDKEFMLQTEIDSLQENGFLSCNQDEETEYFKSLLPSEPSESNSSLFRNMSESVETNHKVIDDITHVYMVPRTDI
jgi:hypothetical protein